MEDACLSSVVAVLMLSNRLQALIIAVRLLQYKDTVSWVYGHTLSGDAAREGFRPWMVLVLCRRLRQARERVGILREEAMVPEENELTRLIQEAEATGGSVGVAIDSSTGWKFRHNSDRRFRAASTVKIPIMIEVFRKTDRGEISLSDDYTVRKHDHSAGSGVLREMHEDLVVTILDLLYLMMSISDNTATNILIDMAGIESVNATMRQLGMEQSTLSRKMQGKPADDPRVENWATAGEYATLVGKLLDSEVASPHACEHMVSILEKQQNMRRIGRYVPEDGIRWGSKTGSISGVTNDVGFATTDAGTVIVSVFCEDLPDMYVGEKLIGDIARRAMIGAGIAEPRFTS